MAVYGRNSRSYLKGPQNKLRFITVCVFLVSFEVDQHRHVRECMHMYMHAYVRIRTYAYIHPYIHTYI